MKSVNWTQVALEFIAVVLGVLLALLLNEWRQNDRDEGMIDRTMAAVEAELASNYDIVSEAREYRISLIPELGSVVAGETQFEDIGFRGTFPPRIQTAAWQVAIQRGVVAELNEDRALDIVRAYTSLEAIEDLHGRYVSVFIANTEELSEDGERAARFIQFAFNDFLFGEDDALRRIAAVTDQPPPDDWWTGFRPGNDSD